MVEDCAGAREARDEALTRVERLEEELENSEGQNIKRLETNIRLQEERLGEMTTELEMMAAQKDAMVEDCASAREARDEALLRVERLEEELESSDGRNVDNTIIVESLIATIAQTVCQARETIRLSREEYTSAQDAHQRTIQEANSSNLELEQRLGVATEKLAELELLREQYNDLKKEHAKQQSRLQEELIRTSHYYQDLERSRDALQDENVRLTEDLTRIQKEHATQIDRCREEKRAIEQELEQQVTSLQGQIEEQGRLLDISGREVTRIRDRLKEEEEGRAQDKTELEAEIQRSKSLIHYLEIQIKDR
jgi:myosin protein heavy chain